MLCHVYPKVQSIDQTVSLIFLCLAEEAHGEVTIIRVSLDRERELAAQWTRLMGPKILEDWQLARQRAIRAGMLMRSMWVICVQFK